MFGPHVAADDLLIEEVNGELCILRLDTGDVLVMNSTAADIWVLASDGTSAAEIVDVLQVHYSCRSSDISEQVSSVLADFAARGFLVPQV